MSRIWISLSLLALIVATVLAVRDATRPAALNVIVLTVESWRADAATPETMPELFEAAAQGVTFTNHRAVSAWTGPNVIAVLTGVSPYRQGVHARGQSVPPEYELLTEILTGKGWDVGGVQAFMRIDLFENLGFDFDPGVDLYNWIAERGRRETPFYFWYHYLDSHLPYNPGGAETILDATPIVDPDEPGRRAEVRRLPVIPEGEIDFLASDREWIAPLYQGGFVDFDRWFGQFWAFFKASGLRDNTILIVTADHGEELLERGNVGHASTTRAGHLHEEIVRVPLFVWAPGGLMPVPDGSIVADMTDHLMIAPMIARMLGIAGGADLESGGLFETPRRNAWTGLTSGAGFAEPDPARIPRFVGAAIRDDLKVQVTTENEVPVTIAAWDLRRDPDEVDSLDPLPAAARALADEVTAWMAGRYRASDAKAEGGVIAAEIPVWIHPERSRDIGYGDIAGRTYLEWTGDENASYVVAYEAGSGLLAMNGTLDVQGTRHDFGAVGERYWKTWVVPYDTVRFRVRPADAAEAWSDWIELELQP